MILSVHGRGISSTWYGFSVIRHVAEGCAFSAEDSQQLLRWVGAGAACCCFCWGDRAKDTHNYSLKVDFGNGFIPKHHKKKMLAKYDPEDPTDTISLLASSFPHWLPFPVLLRGCYKGNRRQRVHWSRAVPIQNLSCHLGLKWRRTSNWSHQGKPAELTPCRQAQLENPDY